MQAMKSRATNGIVMLSARAVAGITGLPRDAVKQAMSTLQASGRIRILEEPIGNRATVWVIPEAETLEHLLAGVVTDRRVTYDENGVPTMPYQPPPPSGEDGGWFAQTFRELSRVHMAVRRGQLRPDCKRCCDTGFYIEPTSVEYDRSWLHVCCCDAGSDREIPDLGPYVPEKESGVCPMCENTGWVYGMKSGTGYEEVQPCHSCRRNIA
jgi:hypothetical protein